MHNSDIESRSWQIRFLIFSLGSELIADEIQTEYDLIQLEGSIDSIEPSVNTPTATRY
jgi:hypothetical protein